MSYYPRFTKEETEAQGDEGTLPNPTADTGRRRHVLSSTPRQLSGVLKTYCIAHSPIDLTVLGSGVPGRILDGLEQSMGWRLEDHQGILGLWKPKT